MGYRRCEGEQQKKGSLVLFFIVKVKRIRFEDIFTDSYSGVAVNYMGMQAHFGVDWLVFDVRVRKR